MTAVPRKGAPGERPPLPLVGAFVLPEPVAETRSIATLLDLAASPNQAPFRRHLKPCASFFRASLHHGGRAQQSRSACAGLLLADTTEDYLAQAVVSAATFAGSWDMKGGDLDALTSLEKTLLRKKMAAHHRLAQPPDTLAAVFVGSIKAVAMACQCRCVAAADDSAMDAAAKWERRCVAFRRDMALVLNCSLSSSRRFSGHPLQPLQLKERKLSQSKSMQLATLENSAAMMTDHILAVIDSMHSLRAVLGRAGAGSVLELAGAEAALLLRYCSHMNWIPDVFAIVDKFCGLVLRLLRWNNSSIAFWHPLADVHVQPLLHFCEQAMARATELLGIGAVPAVRSSSILLTLAIACLSRSWHRVQFSVDNRSIPQQQRATLLIKACARMCTCVSAARSCSDMPLFVSLVASLARARLLLQCVWTLASSALQLRVFAAQRPTDASFGDATEAWAVACAQAASFLILLHAPVRAELIAPLLYDKSCHFSALSCGATREEMLPSAAACQRSALSLAACLDSRSAMTSLQQILAGGAGMSPRGRFLITCTVFGQHATALQPPPPEVCDSAAGGICSAWSLRLRPVLLCCGEQLSVLHLCALAAANRACRVNVSAVVAAAGPAVLRALSRPDAPPGSGGDALDLSVVDVAVLCAVITSDGGCDWMFAKVDRLVEFFEAMCRVLEFSLSSAMASSSLTKIVIHAFAVFVVVILDVVAPSPASPSRTLLRNSLQLPSIELSSVQYLKHPALIDKVDRLGLSRMLCTCIRSLRRSASALGDAECCVISSVLMATRDVGGSSVAITDAAWPLLARMLWRTSLDAIQFVEALSDVSSALEKQRPASLMSLGLPCMGIVIACVVLEVCDANFTLAADSASAAPPQPVKTVRDMFPVDLNPISVASAHAAPYVRALVGNRSSDARIPTLVLLSPEADDAVAETLHQPLVQQQLSESAGTDLRVSDFLGDVAVVFSKLPTLLQFVLSRVVRKLGLRHADAAAAVCKRSLGAAIVMSSHEWSACNGMAAQVAHGLGLHALVQATVSDADAASGVFSLHQLPPLQMNAQLREEAERQIVARDRPNMKIRLQSRVAAAAARTSTGAALSQQAHSAVKASRNAMRERLFGMLLKLYPQMTAQQQQLKVVALSCVRDAWIERALVPLWVSERVLKTQVSGRSSRRRATMSDVGLLPALLQVRNPQPTHRLSAPPHCCDIALQSTATSMFDRAASASMIRLLNKFPFVKQEGAAEGASASFTEYFMSIVTLVLNDLQQLPLFLVSLKAVVNQMLPVRPALISNCMTAMQIIVDAACALPFESPAHIAELQTLETFMQNALMLLPGMFKAAAAAIDASHNSATVDARVVDVLSNPEVSERWRLLEAQHLRKMVLRELVPKGDVRAWRALFVQLLEFVDAIQRKRLNLTSGVQQVIIMACSSQLDAQTLPLALVSTMVASFSTVIASAPCFFAAGSAEAAKWTDVAVALDIIGNLLGIIIRTGGGTGSAMDYVKTCFANVAKMCLCFPDIEPSQHAVAHVACWSCLSNCCAQAFEGGLESFASRFVLELLQQVDVLALLLKSKQYAIDRTGGKLQIDTDEVLHRVLCLPDNAPELDDDAEMVSQVRRFIQDCCSQQRAEQLPRVLMEPVDRWLSDLVNLDIANGLDALDASSFMPPLLDWQMEAVELNAALSAAVKDMGNQLLMLRPAVFKNPFQHFQADVDETASSMQQHHAAASGNNISAGTACGDVWQPYNPWSNTQRSPVSATSKLGHGSGSANPQPQIPLQSDRDSEQEEEAAAAAGDTVFESVKKRVAISTRELIADKMRRMAPPQWLHPCISITAFVFKMCELEDQQNLRKEFLQSDIRLLLYTIYTRFEADEVGKLAHTTLKLL